MENTLKIRKVCNQLIICEQPPKEAVKNGVVIPSTVKNTSLNVLTVVDFDPALNNVDGPNMKLEQGGQIILKSGSARIDFEYSYCYVDSYDVMLVIDTPKEKTDEPA